MKKQISRKALIVGAVIGVILVLCAMPILINNINKDATKLAKVEEPETKQYSTAPTVGSESELEKFIYDKNNTEKTVTLKNYKYIAGTSLTIYSEYSIGGINYSTIIDSGESIKNGKGSFTAKTFAFSGDSILQELTIQDNVIINNISLYGEKNIKTVNFGRIKFNGTSMIGMFSGCESLTSLDLSGFDTPNVTNMAFMFSGCTSLTSVNVSNWNTSKVTDMENMFKGCTSLTNVDVSNWNTSKVTDMTQMFQGCSSLINLNLNNLLNVTYMNNMFWGCTSLKSIGLNSLGTSKVATMRSMFNGCESLANVDLSNFDTSNVTDISYMFNGCISLKGIDLSSFNTSKVISMDGMFYECESLTNVDLSNWDTRNVTSIVGIFRGCTSLTNVDLSNWDTTNVTNMVSLFYGCGRLTNLDISSFEMTKVNSYGYMFEDCDFDILVTPKVGITSVDLPYTMYDENGTSYTKLPSTLKTLYKEIPTKKYTVTFVSEGTTVDTQTVEEGQGATAPSLVKEGYTLSWDKEFSNVTSDLTVNAVWTPNTETAYTVEHYKQGESGYALADTDNLTGTTDSTVTAEAKTYAGYTENTTISQRVPSGIVAGDGSLVLKLYYDRNTDTAYTVKHYKQQGNTTTYTLADIDNLTGTTDSTVTAEAKTYEGYVENIETSQRIPSGIVTGDGSLELVLIYDTIKLTVTFKDGEDIVETKTVVYGENVIPPSIEKPGYTLTWDKSLENIIEDQTINAVWTANEGIAYKVEHYQQNTDLETYTLADTDNLTGTTGEEITATLKEYTGFSIQETDNTVSSGVVAGDGSLVLKLYYNRNNYAVTLNKNEGTINTGNVLQYTYGIGATLPTDVEKTGYVFRGWYEESDFSGTEVRAIGETDIGAKVYYAKWLKDTDGDGTPDIEDNDTQVKYTVEHYKQNTDLETYTLQEIENTLTGQLGSTVTAEPKIYTGFNVAETQNTVESGTVVDDGSLVLKLYYNRETYEISYETNGGTIEDENYATRYTYGIVESLPSNVTKAGYTFGGWYENIVEETAREYARSIEETEGKIIVSQTGIEDTGAKIYNANWIAKGNTAYKVLHYKQGENGYILEETDNLTAETESEVTAVPKTYEGYVENINHEDRVASGTVLGDGSLELKLYYDKITYEVTFKDGETVLDTQTINYGESAVAPTPKKEGYVLRWDKEFDSVKSDLIVNAVWKRDTDGDGIPDDEDPETLVKYIVRHYKQQGNTNTYELADTEELQGQLGSEVTAEPKTYEGYVENTETNQRIPNGIVTGEETLQLRLFYDTIKYEVIFKNGEEVVGRQVVPYGGNAIAPVLEKEGYILSWDKNLNNITIDQTINAVWTKVEDKQIEYKIEHYVETKEGKYILKEIDTSVGKIGEIVVARAKTYEPYNLDETNTQTIKTGKLEENKELVLKLYYKYKRFEVIFKDGEEEVGREEVIYGETVNPPKLTKPGYILSWDKELDNITGEQTLVAVWTKDPNYKDPNAGKDNITNNKPDEGKDDKKPSILPQTGEEIISLGAMMGLLGMAVVYFVKYKF